MSRRIEIVQKLIAVLLVIFCLACSLAPAADALGALAGLTIAGQAVMSTGMLNNLLVIGADACGFTNAIRDAIDNSSTAQTIGEFIEEQFSLWRGDYGMALVHALNVAQSGTKYLEDGRLVFDYAMSNMMDSFYEWLWSVDGGNLMQYATVISGSESSVSGSLVDGILTQPFPIASRITVHSDASNGDYSIYDFNAPVLGTSYISGSNTNLYLLFASDTVVTINYTQYSYNNNGVLTNTLTGSFSTNSNTGLFDNKSCYYGYYYISGTRRTNTSSTISIPLLSSITQTDMRKIAWTIFYGDITSIGDYVENPGAFHLPDPSVYDTNVINPTDSIAFPNYPSDTIDGTMAIGDYLTGLADLIGSAVSDAVISLPIELTDGISSTIELELTDALPIEQAKEADITGAEDATTNPSPGDLGPYTIDLRDFFPFCIPFDIYRMLTMFRGSAEAPRFTWRFYVPNVVDQNIVIDLSGFDSAARILRSMELIAFCIGLAFVTKKLIQGGD